MPRLLWLAHHRPDIYRQAATLTMNQRLAGKYAQR
jgi:sugar (pentulose or hexulose) kinase